MNTRRSIMIVLGALVTACNQQGGDKAAPAAGGEVLPGSISDAMLDLDTSTATPPMAAPKVRSTTRSTRDAETAGESADRGQAPAPGASGGAD